MMEKLVNLLKRMDNPNMWSNIWFYPAILFSLLTLGALGVGMWSPSGYAFAAAVTCIVAYLSNRLFVIITADADDS